MDLLERLGGPTVVRTVSDALYDRLLSDDEVGPLFAETHMPSQRSALAGYLEAALAGRPEGRGERLREAHAGNGVTDRHFSIMASHLADVLDSLEVDDDVTADVLELIAERRADVVSDSVVADAWLPTDPDA